MFSHWKVLPEPPEVLVQVSHIRGFTPAAKWLTMEIKPPPRLNMYLHSPLFLPGSKREAQAVGTSVGKSRRTV